MKILALAYVVIGFFALLVEPFLFGESRGEYGPKVWLLKVLLNAPLLWLLWNIAL